MNNVKTELLSAKSSELPEPQKLFIGIEIEVANYLGYPLLERLIGHKNEYFDEFCRECPDTKFSILGRGSPYELTHEQNLYIRIDAKTKNEFERANHIVSKRIIHVRKEFEEHQKNITSMTATVVSNFPNSLYRDFIAKDILKEAEEDDEYSNEDFNQTYTQNTRIDDTKQAQNDTNIQQSSEEDDDDYNDFAAILKASIGESYENTQDNNDKEMQDTFNSNEQNKKDNYDDESIFPVYTVYDLDLDKEIYSGE